MELRWHALRASRFHVVDGKAPQIGSAIVTPAKPRRKPNTMLAHLLDRDGSEAGQRRRGDLADELFRTIVRRAARQE